MKYEKDTIYFVKKKLDLIKQVDSMKIRGYVLPRHAVVVVVVLRRIPADNGSVVDYLFLVVADDVAIGGGDD